MATRNHSYLVVREIEQQRHLNVSFLLPIRRSPLACDLANELACSQWLGEKVSKRDTETMQASLTSKSMCTECCSRPPAVQVRVMRLWYKQARARHFSVSGGPGLRHYTLGTSGSGRSMRRPQQLQHVRQGGRQQLEEQESPPGSASRLFSMWLVVTATQAPHRFLKQPAVAFLAPLATLKHDCH